jgi:hypothetical protein
MKMSIRLLKLFHFSFKQKCSAKPDQKTSRDGERGVCLERIGGPWGGRSLRVTHNGRRSTRCVGRAESWRAIVAATIGADPGDMPRPRRYRFAKYWCKTAALFRARAPNLVRWLGAVAQRDRAPAFYGRLSRVVTFKLRAGRLRVQVLPALLHNINCATARPRWRRPCDWIGGWTVPSARPRIFSVTPRVWGATNGTQLGGH